MRLSASETSEVLEKLAKSASWWRRVVQAGGAAEVHQVISKLSPRQLIAIDQNIRGGGAGDGGYYLHLWRGLKPSGVRRLARSKFAVSLLGLASFHPNGYVREAAVAELASNRTGKELPFLLIRVNDWVPQVRDAAARAVDARFQASYAIHLLANIALVLRLRHCGRVDKELIDETLDLLKRPECKDVLLGGTKSTDKTVRRISFQLAADADPSSRSAIIRAVMEDPDAVARLWAVRHFLPDVSPAEIPRVVEPLLRDRFMPVRRDALWFAATKREDFAREPVRSALLDHHVSMRETARQFSALAGVDSVRDYYADALESGKGHVLYASICGLGETGSQADAALVAPFLESQLPKIRRAAVYALGKLDLESRVRQLVGMLADPKPGVSREALKALRSKPRSVALSELESLMADSAQVHVRCNALSLISRGEKWKRVPPLLRACADNDPGIAEQAAKALGAWFHNYNRSYAEPAAGDCSKISEALSQFESSLPHGAAGDLRDCLRIYCK